MTPLRLIALDLSLESPGYAWTTTPDDVRKVAVRTVPAHDDDECARREAALSMIRKLTAIRPHLCAIEDIFAGKNSRTGIALAKLHGVIEQELWKAGIPYVHVHQALRAIYATGRGNAPKADVLAAVRYTYGQFVGGASRIRTTDDGDALALYTMTADYYGQALVEVDETKRRALSKVKWPRLILKDERPRPGLILKDDGSAPLAGVGSAARVPSPVVPAVLFVASQDRTQLP